MTFEFEGGPFESDKEWFLEHKEGQKDKQMMTWLIAISIILVLIILCAIATPILVVCMCRRKKRKDDEDSDESNTKLSELE